MNPAYIYLIIGLFYGVTMFIYNWVKKEPFCDCLAFLFFGTLLWLGFIVYWLITKWFDFIEKFFKYMGRLCKRVDRWRGM